MCCFFCISGEISDQWGPFIEFVIFFIFQGFNVGTHFGVWIITKTKIIDQTGIIVKNVSAGISLVNLTTNTNSTNNYVNISSMMPVLTFKNITLSPEEVWKDLIKFRQIYLYVCIVGAVLFVIQLLLLLPNVVKHFLEADPSVLKDGSAHCYFRKVFIFNVLMLIFTSVAFDVPIGVLTVRLVEDIWKGDALTEEKKLTASVLMISLSLAGLAFMALYKGMMPLFLWIGNPFCFPCVWLRLFIALPGGLVALVMTFAPPMGYAKHSLLSFAPPAMKAKLGDLANTFFSIGMIFWGVAFVLIFVITACYYRFCYEPEDGKSSCCCC